jgi:hypothetical protein
MSEKNSDFVKRSCTKSPKRYTDVSNSDDESKDDDLYSPHFGGGAQVVMAKKNSSKMFNAFSEIREDNSLVGYDGYSRAVCVAFIGTGGEKRGATEYCWIPLDALKNDARDNPVFLREIEEYVKMEDGKFWRNPPQYIEAVDQAMWSIPRSSITNWHSTIVKDPFIAMTLPTPECNECIVFFKLSDRKTNGGTTYTSLKVLVESLMDGGKDTIARNLLKFARNHANVIRRFIASGDEAQIKKFFGFSIALSNLSQKTPDANAPLQSRLFLQSIDPNYARDLLRPVAEKYLSRKSYDADLWGWYEPLVSSYAGVVPATYTVPDNVVLKMAAVIDKLSSSSSASSASSSGQGSSLTFTVPEADQADIEASDAPFVYERKKVDFAMGGKEEEAEQADIEASDAPFVYEGKKVDFAMGGKEEGDYYYVQGGKKRGRDQRPKSDGRPGVMPMDLEEFDLPADFAGKTIKFVSSPSRNTVIIGGPFSKLDNLVMAASIISRDEETKDNGPFALGGNMKPYKKRNPLTLSPYED